MQKDVNEVQYRLPTLADAGEQVEAECGRGSWKAGILVGLCSDGGFLVALRETGNPVFSTHVRVRAVHATHHPLLVAVATSELARLSIVARCKAMQAAGDRLFAICDSNIATSLDMLEAAGLNIPLVVGEEITGFDILIGYEHGTGGRNAKNI